MEASGASDVAPTFTSVLLQSEDLLPSLLFELDFTSLGRLSGACQVLRQAVGAMIQNAVVCTPQPLVPPKGREPGARYLFVAAFSNGDLAISDAPDGEGGGRVVLRSHGEWRSEYPGGSMLGPSDATSCRFMPTGLGIDGELLFAADANTLSAKNDRLHVLHPFADSTASHRIDLPRHAALDALTTDQHLFPLGVAVDGERVFVVLSDAHCVVSFRRPTEPAQPSAPPPAPDDGSGTVVLLGAQDGKPGSSCGQLRDPFDVAVHDGLLYATDSGNHRVAVFNAVTGAWHAHILACDPPFDE